MSRERILAAALLLPAACGGAPPPAPAAAPTATAAASAAPDAAKPAEDPADKPYGKIPTSCDSQTNGVCLPPAEFAKRLCGASYPEVALAMFSKGTPWTRGYLRREVEAWNASGGGPRSSSEKMAFEEEVVIVVYRAANTGGMTVSGATGSYDVLRWDGSCASLMGEEVTTRAPLSPKHAKIPWKSLEDPTREALLANEKIGKFAAERKKECK